MSKRTQQTEKDCIFCKILRGEIPSWIINQNDKFAAFLTPFPNTPGVTVVIPKEHKYDYAFDMNDEDYCEYLKYIKTVVNRIDKVFGVSRTAMVFEGTQISHVHAKIFPLHGYLGGSTDVESEEKEYVEEYRGFLTTLGGPKMDDKKLDELRDKLKF